jgi:23S rRNA pseudouridine2605 synthase
MTVSKGEKLGPRSGRVRLDRALSKLGLASRTGARGLILSGRVTLHGKVVTDPGHLVTPERAGVAVDGRQQVTRPWRTIAFHKPRGIVTTRRDPEGRKTVFDILGDDGRGLVSVGRLDLASTGLLLLTTDTRLANWLTDPANAVVRRYIVTARGAVSDDAARQMEAGSLGLRAERVQVRKRSNRETHLVIELTEGRIREIRRLLAACGHDVTRLMRVAFAGIELGTLQPGEWKEISREEMREAGCLR